MATSVDDVKSALFWRAVVAELVGTLFLTLVGCGSCIGWEKSYSPSMVQIALAFGLIVATMVWCIGHISGGHINPAVTVALLITRKISVARAVLFVLAQCIGAVLGAAFLKGVTPEQYRGYLGATMPQEDMGPHQAFGVEFLITFVLLFTVFASTDSMRTDLGGSIPLTVGLSVGVCHLWAIKFTGSSMNPARSLGPAVVMNIWRDHWVYWCGPLLGGIAAALVYENVFAVNASITKAKGYLLSSNYDPEHYEPNREQPAEIKKAAQNTEEDTV